MAERSGISASAAAVWARSAAIQAAVSGESISSIQRYGSATFSPK